MKKTFLTLLFLSSITSSFAQEKSKVFPEQGLINFLGLDDTSSSPSAKDGRAADIQNVSLNISGEASRRKGVSEYVLLDTNATVDNFEAVTGIYELYKSNGTRTKIATCGSKIFSITPNAKTDITSGVTITEGQNNQFNWATALDLAIGTNWNDPPIQTNGTTTSALSFTGLTNSITKAKCVVWWKNYLIFGNTVENSVSRTTRIRWSNVGTVNTWSDDDFIDIATLGGQEIEGFGILQDNLYIFLTDSIYKASLVGGDELLLTTKISENIGCIAKNSIKNIPIRNREGLAFLSRDSTINFLDGINITEISTLISGVMDDLKDNRLLYAAAEVDKFNGHYYLAVTDDTDTVDDTVNNLLLDYYYILEEWLIHTQIDANAMGIANDVNSVPQVYFGNYKSFVYQLNNTNFNDDVAGLTGLFDGSDIIDTETASGLTILYDTALSNYDILLCHFNGENGSTNFIDEANKTITTNGDTKITTAQYEFGGASALFDGNGDYLSLADSDDWNFGTGDFTIDFWARFNVNSGRQVFYIQKAEGNYVNCIVFEYIAASSSWSLQVYNNTGANILSFTAADSLSVNTWYHVALIRNGNNWYIFRDGTQKGTVSDSITMPDSSQSLLLGEGLDWGVDFNGWIDELRISKGIARWTSDFIVPTSAYTNSSISSRFDGAVIRIISGTGTDEERVICDTTATGLIVTNSTTAAINSEYSIGLIDSYITTKWYDCGSPSRRKHFQDLFLWLTKKTTPTLNVYYASDEVSTIESKNLSDYAVDNLWGTEIASGVTVIWQGEELSFAKIPLNLSGRFLKLKFEEDNLSETMNLVGYSIIFQDLDVY